MRPCTDEGPSTSTLLDSQSTMLCSSTAASDPSINFQEQNSSKEKDPLNGFHEEDPSFLDITVGHFSITDGQSLSVSVEEGIANTHLPKPTAEGIWKKAAMLVGVEKAIVPAPGFGPDDKMEKSKSGATPHLVTVARSDTMVQYKCDDKCPQYKSVCICSQTIAAAELIRDLVDFLKWFQQNRGKKMPNLSELGSHGIQR